MVVMRGRVVVIVSLIVLYRHCLGLLLVKFLHSIYIRSWRCGGVVLLWCLVKWLGWCQCVVLLIFGDWWDRVIHVDVDENCWLLCYLLWLFNRLSTRLQPYKLIPPFFHMRLAPLHQPVIELHLIPLPILRTCVFQEMNLLCWQWVPLIEII